MKRHVLLLVWTTLCCLAATWMGCGSRDRLVVYADPWMADYATAVTEAFQAEHPEVDLQLKMLSSEVVAQHIRFGQPVDVFLCLGSEFLQQEDFRKQVADEQALADLQLVRASNAQDHSAKQMNLGTRGCYLLEATDRPLRRYADRFFAAAIPSDSCTIIANFPQQAQAYMLRGWAQYFFLPHSFAVNHPDLIAPSGPESAIPDAFSAILLQNAPNQSWAAAFFAFTVSEKSKQILGELNFLP